MGTFLHEFFSFHLSSAHVSVSLGAGLRVLCGLWRKQAHLLEALSAVGVTRIVWLASSQHSINVYEIRCNIFLTCAPNLPLFFSFLSPQLPQVCSLEFWEVGYGQDHLWLDHEA